MLAATMPLLDFEIISSTLNNISTLLSVVGGLFLFSIPLGYWEHQLVVNVYRSEKKPRPAHLYVRDMVLEAQKSIKTKKKDIFFESFSDRAKNSFLTALVDMCIFSRNSSSDANIYGRLSDRWSHFYARRAVGRYAPIISIVLWTVSLVAAYLCFGPLPFRFGWQNFLVSAIVWMMIFAVSICVIDSYSGKIWAEISFLEGTIVLARKKENSEMIKNVVENAYENPEYIEQAEKSYSTSFYKM
jgi:sensor histidine kinase YesM